MAQVVYYGCWDNKFSHDLEPVRNHFINGIFNGVENAPKIKFCPAFNDHLKNVYAVKSIYQYNIRWDGKDITSSMYNQDFFDTNISIRNLNTGVLSYVSPKPIFISEDDSLDISQETPYFHNNDISRNLYVMPGTFDIGKHIPRPLELACKFKQPCSVDINEGDALYYIKFHTKEKIIFKKFIITEELKTLSRDNLSTRGFMKNLKSMQWWYDHVSRHNLKKYFLREIKKNLL
jgi:hypothetical protein